MGFRYYPMAKLTLQEISTHLATTSAIRSSHSIELIPFEPSSLTPISSAANSRSEAKLSTKGFTRILKTSLLVIGIKPNASNFARSVGSGMCRSSAEIKTIIRTTRRTLESTEGKSEYKCSSRSPVEMLQMDRVVKKVYYKSVSRLIERRLPRCIPEVNLQRAF